MRAELKELEGKVPGQNSCNSPGPINDREEETLQPTLFTYPPLTSYLAVSLTQTSPTESGALLQQSLALLQSCFLHTDHPPHIHTHLVPPINGPQAFSKSSIFPLFYVYLLKGFTGPLSHFLHFPTLRHSNSRLRYFTETILHTVRKDRLDAHRWLFINPCCNPSVHYI